jgi:oligoribonuclease NrnB/cAMP/cGMP phosphodiesterase (DHH superfamily)
MAHKNIVVIYHADCPDGFGAAYSAWKKFGDAATYMPMKYHHEPPYEEFRGREVYMVDFSYPKEIMDRLLEVARSFVVLDHHEGVQDVVESMPEHVYDKDRSGATIAWSYFHHDKPAPKLLQHIEDVDLYNFKLPETKPLLAYLSVQPFTFEFWDTIAAELESSTKHDGLVERAKPYLDYFNYIVELSVRHAHPVKFEGHETLIANASPIKTLKSAIGHALAEKKPPIGLVVSVHPNGIGVSIRGDGSVDVSEIARKYGGNGHPNSSGFQIPWQTPMPFTSLEE